MHSMFVWHVPVGSGVDNPTRLLIWGVLPDSVKLKMCRGQKGGICSWSGLRHKPLDGVRHGLFMTSAAQVYHWEFVAELLPQFDWDPLAFSSGSAWDTHPHNTTTTKTVHQATVCLHQLASHWLDCTSSNKHQRAHTQQH